MKRIYNLLDALTYGSVCSGIEAASVAWHELGLRAAWLSEIEPFPCAVLKHHYPDVPNLGDMRTISRRVLNGTVAAPDILVGGTPCFTAGHMVLTSDGYRPIESIAPGDMVVTHEGRLRPVVRIGSKMAHVGRVTGVGIGEDIVCTPDHPFRSVAWRNQNTRRGNKYAVVEHIGEPEWTTAEDMPGKQWCALTEVDVSAPALPCGFDVPELLYIAGFYLGDGFIRRWTGKSKKAVVFGVNPAKVDRFLSRVTLPVSVTSERTTTRIVLCRTEIADWLIEQFGELSHGKRLPAWVLSHPQRSALMDGYRDTDGHETSNGWRAISVSRSLAYGMRDLAQTLGMVASVAFSKVAPTKVIEGRTVNQRDYWTVCAFNGETSRKSRVRHGMLLRKVGSFEETGDETVFNIEVDGDHSYVLDGAIVHNCQAFSIAGLREGLDDDRGQLTLTYVRLFDAIDYVRECSGREPAIAIWENVPGVLSSKDNAFGCFLGALAGEDDALKPPGGKWANAGCVFGPKRAIAWRVQDAQYFGLAQRRRRVFVVSSARKGFDPSAILFEFDGVRRDSPPSREAQQDVTGTLSARTSGGGGLGTDFDLAGGVVEEGLRHVTGTIDAAGGGADENDAKDGRLIPVVARCLSTSNQRIDWETETFIPSIAAPVTRSIERPRGDGLDALLTVLPFDTTQITSKTNRCQPDYGDPCHPLAAGAHPPAIAFQDRFRGDDGRGYDRVPPVSVEQVGTLETVKQWNVCVTGDVTHTLKADGFDGFDGFDASEDGTGRGQPIVPSGGMRVRRLTPVECERLQGFHDDYTSIPTWNGWRAMDESETPESCIAEGLEVRQTKKTGKWRVKDVDGPRYKALGNSMAVPCMRHLGRRVIAYLNNQLPRGFL